MTTTAVPEQRVQQEASLLERLRRSCREVQVIDGHDHLLRREEVLTSGDVLLHLFVSSVLPPSVVASDPVLSRQPLDPDAGWDALKRRLPEVSETPAYRIVVNAIHRLYGFDGFPLDAGGYRELRERMLAAYRQPDWYRLALRDVAGIDIVICSDPRPDLLWCADTDLCLPVPNLTEFVQVYRPEVRTRLEQRYHLKLQDFSDFKGLMDVAFAEIIDCGLPAVSLSHNRFRPLQVSPATWRQAAALFDRPAADVAPHEAKLFEDFTIHHIAERCAANGLPLQIDTGWEPDASVARERGDPAELAMLFAEHQNTRFVCLHAGYPFWRHLGVLSKTFPNVYMDAGGLAQHPTPMVRDVLGEWIELVPVAKILLGAGNARRIEATIGSVLMMREIVAEVLCERVESGLFTGELALDLARKLLREVPRRFYRTEELRIRRQTADFP